MAENQRNHTSSHPDHLRLVMDILTTKNPPAHQTETWSRGTANPKKHSNSWLKLRLWVARLTRKPGQD
jgi:hypothetical protein